MQEWQADDNYLDEDHGDDHGRDHGDDAHSSPECVQLYKSGDLRYVTVIVQGMGSAQHAGDRQVVDHQDVDHHDVDHYDQH